jgi:protein SCO1/2
MSKYILTGIAVAIGVVITVVLGIFLIDQNYTFTGSIIDPPTPAADFELTDQYGQPYRLSDQRGDFVLIFFGYTNCPDVCPVTLSEYKRIKEGMGDLADQVQFVFITVDPERDTPERLDFYISNFDSSFVGLTADRETLEKVWQAYGVYQERREVGSAAGYLVDHTSRTYGIDQAGNFRISFYFETPVENIVDDLTHIIDE